jgi:integrase
MGRTRQQWRPSAEELVEGVPVRGSGLHASIVLSFRYRGVRCRETLKGLEVTKPNYAYAVRLRGEILNKIAVGTFRYGDYFPHSPRARRFGEGSSRASVGQIIDAYIHKFSKAAELGNASRGTLRVFKGYASQLKDEMGPVLAADLAPFHLREFLDRRKCTAKTLRNTMSFLRTVVGEAMEDGIITSNPFAGIDLKRAIKKVAVKPTYEVDPFNAEERAAFLAACPNDEERDMYTFWFETGLRPSELIMLEWSKLDENHQPARIRIDMAAAERLAKAPKTKAGTRNVELTQVAIAALKRQKARTLLAGGRIWRSPKFEAPWVDETQLRRSSYRHILKKAKLRWRRPYQVRHTFASTLCSRGANIYWLATQMGHKDIETIIRHYGRWIEGVAEWPTAMQSRDNPQNGHTPSTSNVVELKIAC